MSNHKIRWSAKKSWLEYVVENIRSKYIFESNSEEWDEWRNWRLSSD